LKNKYFSCLTSQAYTSFKYFGEVSIVQCDIQVIGIPHKTNCDFCLIVTLQFIKIWF